MKKLINDPADVVAEALLGVAAAHPELRVDHEHKIVYRGDAPVTGKVGLISGGGSGHEPLHGGFVGLGMLDAACAGEVFTSPVPDQMLEATRTVDGGAGVLHIVKNYTGDVMNFEMAAELAAADTGVEVISVVTDDDVAVQDSLYTAGRRGVGVTVLVEKIAGAAAEEGRNLADVAEVAKRVNANGRSMGMALTSCTVPAAGRPTFDLPDDEIEIGIGIHGEPGRRRVPLAPAARGRGAAGRADPRRPRLHGRRRRARLRQRHGRHAAAGAVPDVRRGRDDPGEGRASRSSGRWSARTSPAWTWPAARSRCSSSTTSCCGCGTRRCAPRGCGGVCVVPDDASTSAALDRWIRGFAERVTANKDLLTQLDSAIGDADHGANMDRGMAAVRRGAGRRAARRPPPRCSSRSG